jgi:Putative adhesin
MRYRRPRSIRGLTTFALLAALVLAARPAAAAAEERRSFDTNELTIRNLIGAVKVSGTSGSKFEVTIRVQGKDSTTPGVDIDASSNELTIKFPEASKYVYPALGPGSRTTFGPDEDDRGWLAALLGAGRVTVVGSGSGVEIWADLDVKVPHGAILHVHHGVGELTAENAKGEIDLHVRSGHVQAERMSGELNIDTGSGHVEVSDIDGKLVVDTGSGHVSASDVHGPSINIDTGSGHVELDDAETDHLRIDTGSGHVRARKVSADDADIDTGSGGVTLELTRMGSGTFKIDTGSGGIDLLVPRGASMAVEAETGSGGVDVDLGDDIDIERMERDEAKFRLGSGAARVVMSTGSGGIDVRYSK